MKRHTQTTIYSTREHQIITSTSPVGLPFLSPHVTDLYLDVPTVFQIFIRLHSCLTSILPVPIRPYYQYSTYQYHPISTLLALVPHSQPFSCYRLSLPTTFRIFRRRQSHACSVPVTTYHTLVPPLLPHFAYPSHHVTIQPCSTHLAHLRHLIHHVPQKHTTLHTTRHTHVVCSTYHHTNTQRCHPFSSKYENQSKFRLKATYDIRLWVLRKLSCRKVTRRKLYAAVWFI